MTVTQCHPRNADPLLRELGQLRKTAPRWALAYAARTRNLSATASLLRAANGLLDLLARIEKAKGEELKAQQATANGLPPAAVQEELDRWLDNLAERMRQAEATAPKVHTAARPSGMACRSRRKSPSRMAQ